MKILASNCFVSKGYRTNLLIDLQNNGWYHINENEIQLLNENSTYLKELLELGIILEVPDFLKNNLSKYDFSYYSFPKIESIIIDKDFSSKFSLIDCLKIFDVYNPIHLQVRFFSNSNFEEILELIEALSDFSIESLELLIMFNNELYNKLNDLNVIIKFSKLRQIIFHSFDTSLKIERPISKKIIFSEEKIKSATNCGQISFFNFSNNKNHILKSRNFNSCLYKKIGIDVKGNIKNCPSLPQVIGNIMDDNLVLNLESLTTSKIKKDEIEVCKDCEFRYICTDCRAFTDSNSRPNARPSKCQYNPYISKWSHEDEYLSLEECGVISNEDEFSIDHEKIALINKQIWGE
ncbi:MAG: SPASM domain-containing protein [Fluviicola sp.]